MVGAARASLTAFGAWPGVAAKVVDGVNAMSRLAAAATKVCERQCVGSVNNDRIFRWSGFRKPKDDRPPVLTCARIEALQPRKLRNGAIAHHPLRCRKRKSLGRSIRLNGQLPLRFHAGAAGAQ